MAKLPKFGKRNVRKAGLTVRKTGDGLSEALAFEPVAYWPGDEIYLVVKAVVVDVAHPAENRKHPDQDDLTRMHIADAIEVASIPVEVAEPLLKEADARLHEFRLAASLEEERAAGIQRLDDALEPTGTEGGDGGGEE
jgi:hypothetical protein